MKMFHENAYIQIFAEYMLIVEIVIFVLIGLSWWFADQNKIRNHKSVITYLLLGQTVLTSFMILRFITSEYARQFLIHALFGLFVYLLILYTYLLMTNKMPKPLAIPKKYRKNLMQITAILWATTVLLGMISFMFVPE